eukprot:m.9843 g.9843  ORF g.9843 m.9843 type:complete len:213 (-) comp4240_c0_seq2:1291-1929(-)
MKLAYGDTQLEDEDISLIKSPGWLNDKVVSFAMEYFDRDEFGETLPAVAFLSAPVVQLVSLISDPHQLGAILGDLQLEDKETIFLPLNDHDDPLRRGGSHWALLVYHAATWHLVDSMSGGRGLRERALVVAERLSAAFSLSKPDTTVPISPCAQQVNGYDCGVYVIAFTHSIATRLASGEPACFEGVLTLSPEAVSDWRERLEGIIKTLAGA